MRSSRSRILVITSETSACLTSRPIVNKTEPATIRTKNTAIIIITNNPKSGNGVIMSDFGKSLSNHEIMFSHNCALSYASNHVSDSFSVMFKSLNIIIDEQAIPLSTQKPPETKLIDASRDDDPYNQNSYPGYDPMNLYEGEYTPLDKMFHEQEGKGKLSANAMDSNWGGIAYTQGAIDACYYSGDEVSIKVA